MKQFNLLFMITEQRFKDVSDTDDHYLASSVWFVIGEGALDHANVRGGGRSIKITVYLSGLGFGYCCETVRSFVHISYTEHSRYVNQNELMSGRSVCKLCSSSGNNRNSFVGGFFNNALVFNTNHVTHVDVHTARILLIALYSSNMSADIGQPKRTGRQQEVLIFMTLRVECEGPS